MNQPMSELPKYKSHKIGRALKIAAIEVHQDKSATIAPLLSPYAPFKTQPGWAERFKGSEADTGYYVVYDDGYASWSPTEAFENGYTRLREDHTPISELTAALKADDDYAWLWLCNLACIGIDSVSDVANGPVNPHEAANRRAAQFMSNAFGLDIRTSERWKEFEKLWKKEANQAKPELAASNPTLEDWMDGWQVAVQDGTSSISREEAERRYYEVYGRPGRPNGED